jgi:hypothetical protein
MITRYYLTYIVLSLLFLGIQCQITPKPKQRVLHAAAVLDDKLYVMGGMYYNDTSNQPVEKECFYLRVSNQFDTTQQLSWVDISSTYTVPNHYGAAAAIGGDANETIILYGGVNRTTMQLIYAFDPNSETWSTPTITGIAPARKEYLTGVADYNGKMFLWGGMANGNSVNDMVILDTVDLIWGKGSAVNVPTSRSSYGAALLPDQTIIYMGMQEIFLFSLDFFFMLFKTF